MEPVGIFGVLLAAAGVVLLLIGRPVAALLQTRSSTMPRPFVRSETFLRRGITVAAALWVVFGLVLVALGR